MYETRRVQHRVVSGYISIVTTGHHLPAFWAHPEIGGPFPGIVLLHDNRGLIAYTRQLVRLLGELGFYVIAPDLFDGQTAATPEQGHALQTHLGEAGSPLVSAALNALATHHRCNHKLAVIGMTMGGTLAIEAALHHTDLQAAVAFDGQLGNLLALLRACQTPLLGFYGERDTPAVKQMIGQMQDAAQTATASCKLVEYADADAGFFDPDAPTYNAHAAENSWDQMLDFLCEHLDANISTTDAPQPM